ncbi:plasmid mobilization protein [Bacteroides pyogenes]|uniref:plasmid mobilization protein n=1 Tax=Bacteroides pyogenes TaxID=310300 RepID=UPI002FDB910C
MNRYDSRTAKWQQRDKEEERINKTEFIKVRCTKEEKQRIKSKAESTGRKFSDYCREILLNGEVIAVPPITANEREAIAILGQIAKFYAQISNLIKVRDERWVHITKNLSLCAKEAFKRFYDPHFRVDDDIYKVLNLTRYDRKM